MTDPGGEMIVYAAPDDGPRVQLRAVDGTVWLSQAEIAELYGTSVPNIIQIARRVWRTARRPRQPLTLS